MLEADSEDDDEDDDGSVDNRWDDRWLEDAEAAEPHSGGEAQLQAEPDASGRLTHPTRSVAALGRAFRVRIGTVAVEIVRVADRSLAGPLSPEIAPSPGGAGPSLRAGAARRASPAGPRGQVGGTAAPGAQAQPRSRRAARSMARPMARVQSLDELTASSTSGASVASGSPGMHGESSAAAARAERRRNDSVGDDDPSHTPLEAGVEGGAEGPLRRSPRRASSTVRPRSSTSGIDSPARTPRSRVPSADGVDEIELLPPPFEARQRYPSAASRPRAAASESDLTLAWRTASMGHRDFAGVTSFRGNAELALLTENVLLDVVVFGPQGAARPAAGSESAREEPSDAQGLAARVSIESAKLVHEPAHAGVLRSSFGRQLIAAVRGTAPRGSAGGEAPEAIVLNWAQSVRCRRAVHWLRRFRRVEPASTSDAADARRRPHQGQAPTTWHAEASLSEMLGQGRLAQGLKLRLPPSVSLHSGGERHVAFLPHAQDAASGFEGVAQPRRPRVSRFSVASVAVDTIRVTLTQAAVQAIATAASLLGPKAQRHQQSPAASRSSPALEAGAATHRGGLGAGDLGGSLSPSVPLARTSGLTLARPCPLDARVSLRKLIVALCPDGSAAVPPHGTSPPEEDEREDALADGVDLPRRAPLVQSALAGAGATAGLAGVVVVEFSVSARALLVPIPAPLCNTSAVSLGALGAWAASRRLPGDGRSAGPLFAAPNAHDLDELAHMSSWVLQPLVIKAKGRRGTVAVAATSQSGARSVQETSLLQPAALEAHIERWPICPPTWNPSGMLGRWSAAIPDNASELSEAGSSVGSDSAPVDAARTPGRSGSGHAGRQGSAPLTPARSTAASEAAAAAEAPWLPHASVAPEESDCIRHLWQEAAEANRRAARSLLPLAVLGGLHSLREQPPSARGAPAADRGGRGDGSAPALWLDPELSLALVSLDPVLQDAAEGVLPEGPTALAARRLEAAKQALVDAGAVSTVWSASLHMSQVTVAVDSRSAAILGSVFAATAAAARPRNFSPANPAGAGAAAGQVPTTDQGSGVQPGGGAALPSVSVTSPSLRPGSASARLSSMIAGRLDIDPSCVLATIPPTAPGGPPLHVRAKAAQVGATVMLAPLLRAATASVSVSVAVDASDHVPEPSSSSWLPALPLVTVDAKLSRRGGSGAPLELDVHLPRLASTVAVATLRDSADCMLASAAKAASAEAESRGKVAARAAADLLGRGAAEALSGVRASLAPETALQEAADGADAAGAAAAASAAAPGPRSDALTPWLRVRSELPCAVTATVVTVGSSGLRPTTLRRPLRPRGPTTLSVMGSHARVAGIVLELPGCSQGSALVLDTSPAGGDGSKGARAAAAVAATLAASYRPARWEEEPMAVVRRAAGRPRPLVAWMPCSFAGGGVSCLRLEVRPGSGSDTLWTATISAAAVLSVHPSAHGAPGALVWVRPGEPSSAVPVADVSEAWRVATAVTQSSSNSRLAGWRGATSRKASRRPAASRPARSPSRGGTLRPVRVAEAAALGGAALETDAAKAEQRSLRRILSPLDGVLGLRARASPAAATRPVLEAPWSERLPSAPGLDSAAGAVAAAGCEVRTSERVRVRGGWELSTAWVLSGAPMHLSREERDAATAHAQAVWPAPFSLRGKQDFGAGSELGKPVPLGAVASAAAGAAWGLSLRSEGSHVSAAAIGIFAAKPSAVAMVEWAVEPVLGAGDAGAAARRSKAAPASMSEAAAAAASAAAATIRAAAASPASVASAFPLVLTRSTPEEAPPTHRAAELVLVPALSFAAMAARRVAGGPAARLEAAGAGPGGEQLDSVACDAVDAETEVVELAVAQAGLGSAAELYPALPLSRLQEVAWSWRHGADRRAVAVRVRLRSRSQAGRATHSVAWTPPFDPTSPAIRRPGGVVLPAVGGRAASTPGLGSGSASPAGAEGRGAVAAVVVEAVPRAQPGGTGVVPGAFVVRLRAVSYRTVSRNTRAALPSLLPEPVLDLVTPALDAAARRRRLAQPSLLAALPLVPRRGPAHALAEAVSPPVLPPLLVVHCGAGPTATHAVAVTCRQLGDENGDLLAVTVRSRQARSMLLPCPEPAAMASSGAARSDAWLSRAQASWRTQRLGRGEAAAVPQANVPWLQVELAASAPWAHGGSASASLAVPVRAATRGSDCGWEECVAGLGPDSSSGATRVRARVFAPEAGPLVLLVEAGAGVAGQGVADEGSAAALSEASGLAKSRPQAASASSEAESAVRVPVECSGDVQLPRSETGLPGPLAGLAALAGPGGAIARLWLGGLSLEVPSFEHAGPDETRLASLRVGPTVAVIAIEPRTSGQRQLPPGQPVSAAQALSMRVRRDGDAAPRASSAAPQSSVASASLLTTGVELDLGGQSALVVSPSISDRAGLFDWASPCSPVVRSDDDPRPLAAAPRCFPVEALSPHASAGRSGLVSPATAVSRGPSAEEASRAAEATQLPLLPWTAVDAGLAAGSHRGLGVAARVTFSQAGDVTLSVLPPAPSGMPSSVEARIGGATLHTAASLGDAFLSAVSDSKARLASVVVEHAAASPLALAPLLTGPALVAAAALVPPSTLASLLDFALLPRAAAEAAHARERAFLASFGQALDAAAPLAERAATLAFNRGTAALACPASAAAAVATKARLSLFNALSGGPMQQGPVSPAMALRLAAALAPVVAPGGGEGMSPPRAGSSALAGGHSVSRAIPAAAGPAPDVVRRCFGDLFAGASAQPPGKAPASPQLPTQGSRSPPMRPSGASSKASPAASTAATGPAAASSRPGVEPSPQHEAPCPADDAGASAAARSELPADRRGGAAREDAASALGGGAASPSGSNRTQSGPADEEDPCAEPGPADDPAPAAPARGSALEKQVARMQKLAASQRDPAPLAAAPGAVPVRCAVPVRSPDWTAELVAAVAACQAQAADDEAAQGRVSAALLRLLTDVRERWLAAWASDAVQGALLSSNARQRAAYRARLLRGALAKEPTDSELDAGARVRSAGEPEPAPEVSLETLLFGGASLSLQLGSGHGAGRSHPEGLATAVAPVLGLLEKLGVVLATTRLPSGLSLGELPLQSTVEALAHVLPDLRRRPGTASIPAIAVSLAEAGAVAPTELRPRPVDLALFGAAPRLNPWAPLRDAAIAALLQVLREALPFGSNASPFETAADAVSVALTAGPATLAGAAPLLRALATAEPRGTASAAALPPGAGAAVLALLARAALKPGLL